MLRLVVVTTPEGAPGFALAGVRAVAAASPEEARDAVLRLIAEGGAAVIGVHEPYLDALPARDRRRMDESTIPVVLALPAGLRAAGEPDRQARLFEVLRRAVGYHITFGGERKEERP